MIPRYLPVHEELDMPQETVLTIAAVITAMGVIIGSVIATYRIVNRISSAIGVDDSGRTLSERLDRVEHQLWPNGGSSLADRVNEIHTDTAANTSKLDLIQDLLSAAASATAAQIADSEVPVPIKRRKKVS
jgi:hypothetical protein